MAYGIDIAAIIFIRSRSGWIVLDAGASADAAQICMELAEEALGEKIQTKIKAVIYSHSHFDHIAGAGMFVREKDIPVIAPVDFEKSKAEDHMYAGIAMTRRLQYQGGMLSGDNTARQVFGTSIIPGEYSYVEPNLFIDKTTTMEIDGVSFDFIHTPNTETTAHMACYIRDYRALYLGDNSMGMLHNTYTMRGAVVRDADFWSEKYYEMYLKYGEEALSVSQGHGIAHWRTEEHPDTVKNVLLDNAAAYKYINDQALLYANMGYTMNEIGAMFEVPACIDRQGHVRPHYGSYSFNAKGVYQKYLGFYDGNPVHLNPLSDVETAKKFVEYAGSEDAVLTKAKEDFDRGEYQWCAVATNYVVFANPENREARYLCADALEQMAYTAESFLMRNAYLCGAAELRNPDVIKTLKDNMNNSVDDMTSDLSAGLILAEIGIAIDCQEACGEDFSFILQITEPDQKEIIERYSVMMYKGTFQHIREAKGMEGFFGDRSVPVITTCRKGLTALLKKKLADYRELFETDHFELLERLEANIVDLSAYAGFHLIEP